MKNSFSFLKILLRINVIVLFIIFTITSYGSDIKGTKKYLFKVYGKGSPIERSCNNYRYQAGFIVQGMNGVITNYHNIADCPEIIVIDYKGDEYSMEIDSVDFKQNLAVLIPISNSKRDSKRKEDFNKKYCKEKGFKRNMKQSSKLDSSHYYCLSDIYKKNKPFTDKSFSILLKSNIGKSGYYPENSISFDTIKTKNTQIDKLINCPQISIFNSVKGFNLNEETVTEKDIYSIEDFNEGKFIIGSPVISSGDSKILGIYQAVSYKNIEPERNKNWLIDDVVIIPLTLDNFEKYNQNKKSLTDKLFNTDNYFPFSFRLSQLESINKKYNMMGSHYNVLLSKSKDANADDYRYLSRRKYSKMLNKYPIAFPFFILTDYYNRGGDTRENTLDPLFDFIRGDNYKKKKKDPSEWQKGTNKRQKKRSKKHKWKYLPTEEVIVRLKKSHLNLMSSEKLSKKEYLRDLIMLANYNYTITDVEILILTIDNRETQNKRIKILNNKLKSIRKSFEKNVDNTKKDFTTVDNIKLLNVLNMPQEDVTANKVLENAFNMNNNFNELIDTLTKSPLYDLKQIFEDSITCRKQNEIVTKYLNLYFILIDSIVQKSLLKSKHDSLIDPYLYSDFEIINNALIKVEEGSNMYYQKMKELLKKEFTNPLEECLFNDTTESKFREFERLEKIKYKGIKFNELRNKLNELNDSIRQQIEDNIMYNNIITAENQIKTKLDSIINSSLSDAGITIEGNWKNISVFRNKADLIVDLNSISPKPIMGSTTLSNYGIGSRKSLLAELTTNAVLKYFCEYDPITKNKLMDSTDVFITGLADGLSFQSEEIEEVRYSNKDLRKILNPVSLFDKNRRLAKDRAQRIEPYIKNKEASLNIKHIHTSFYAAEDPGWQYRGIKVRLYFYNYFKPYVDKFSNNTYNRWYYENYSDVDSIPERKKKIAKSDSCYVLCIGNSDYSFYMYNGQNRDDYNVHDANHDAKKFAEFCEKELTIPKQNIKVLNDGTQHQMKQDIRWLRKKINSIKCTSFILYYAGKIYYKTDLKNLTEPGKQAYYPEFYLIPVDEPAGKKKGANQHYKCIKLVSKLNQVLSINKKKGLVILDAVFDNTDKDFIGYSLSVFDCIKDPSNKKFEIRISKERSISPEKLQKLKHGPFTYRILKGKTIEAFIERFFEIENNLIINNNNSELRFVNDTN